MEGLKKKGIRSVFNVKDKYFLSPHYIRVVFEMNAEQIDWFADAQAGANNKIFIPPVGSNQIHFPDDALADKENFATRRTYTTRHIDLKNKELWIDFVAHGDNGPASAWANKAKTGDVLGIAMKAGNRPLFPEADEYLFVGDSTALPVIAAMLSQIPAHVKVSAVVEVFGAEDEIVLSCAAALKSVWLHNLHPENGSELAEYVRKMDLPEGKRYVFFAGEAEIAKNLKEYFKGEQQWLPTDFSIVSYWKKGESEDQSDAERSKQRRA